MIGPLCIGLSFLFHFGLASLSDYGGDVSQYMSLLQGTSAFSFKPGASTEDDDNADVMEMKEPEMRSAGGVGDQGANAMEDFGGDYGDYLKLLEGESALGYNPQSDPIMENQDLQTDVFGGGMSGKFWNMYKGKTSYDSFDEDDKEVVEEMGIDDERQASEEDQKQEMEELARSSAYKKPSSKAKVIKKDDNTVVVAFKPGKEMLRKIYDQFKQSLAANGTAKIDEVLGKLHNLTKGRETRATSDEDSDPHKEDAQQREAAEKALKEYIENFTKSVPDPVTTSRALTMNVKNLTMYGVSELRTCGKLRRYFGSSWKGILCAPRFSAMVHTSSGPGVPFNGKVTALFEHLKMNLVLNINGDSSVHVKTVSISFKSVKYVPTYESSVPLNPWSKVSMSGYMVARVKKSVPRVLSRTLLRLMHTVEKMSEE